MLRIKKKKITVPANAVPVNVIILANLWVRQESPEFYMLIGRLFIEIGLKIDGGIIHHRTPKTGTCRRTSANV